MQQGAIDYYSIEEEGCCLKCPDAEEGCLCYECKCKKCYWYSSPAEFDGYKGHCDYVEILKEKGKKDWREYYLKKAKREWELTKVLDKNNEITLNLILIKGKIPNWYSCQKCKRDFVTEKEEKIEINKHPLCDICLGKIEVKK